MGISETVEFHWHCSCITVCYYYGAANISEARGLHCLMGLCILWYGVGPSMQMRLAERAAFLYICCVGHSLCFIGIFYCTIRRRSSNFKACGIFLQVRHCGAMSNMPQMLNGSLDQSAQ